MFVYFVVGVSPFLLHSTDKDRICLILWELGTVKKCQAQAAMSFNSDRPSFLP